MKKVVIVIPIYKATIQIDEEKSLRQCLKILGKHPICFVTHNALDVISYTKIVSEYECKTFFELFDSSYFEDISGYNKLCLSRSFYERFTQYDYMLIYQLDAWVFSDELIKWCEKDYDYIGAPWFLNFGSHEDGDVLWRVGNGGFSLRKISYFLTVYNWKFPLMKPKIKKLLNIHYIVYYLGRHNTINYFQQNTICNEDYFWSVQMQNSWLPPHIPNCVEACSFAFERSPAFLFNVNKLKLPFGCHAYIKNDYYIFWKNYI